MEAMGIGKVKRCIIMEIGDSAVHLFSSCPDAYGIDEKCLQPIIPNCVDRTAYCTTPPEMPSGAFKVIIEQPVMTYQNITNTTITYSCETPGYAFGYSIDSTAQSFAFTHNIASLTIICNNAGYAATMINSLKIQFNYNQSFLRFWNVSDQVEGETCVEPQLDGTCTSVAIPECVDRRVYCNDPPELIIGHREVISGNLDSITLYGSQLRYECQEKDHHFDYQTPTDLQSFYYSTNINNISVKCNFNG
jgi:hypothetical protein